MNDEGMSELIDATQEGVFMRVDGLSLDAVDIETAVEGCPVDIIRVSRS